MAVFETTSKKHDFDLDHVYETLKRCKQTDDYVNIDEYLQAYHELCRFFKLTGTLFGFVAKDLEGKIKTIETRRKGPGGHHYNNVRSMLQYEANKDISKVKGHLHSGSRMFLRLHWAFEFILEFMSRISNSSDNDKTSVIAAEVYEQTLSKHHPWITRKMAAIAMHFLPSRKDLIEVMCKQDYETVLDMLHKVVEVGRTVYDTTERLYSDFGLLHIP